MINRTYRAALALATAIAFLVPATTADAQTAAPPSTRWAEITRVTGGYHYLASQLDSNLTITRVGVRVVFHDSGMRRFRTALPPGCRRVTVSRGIAASCRIPAWVTSANPLQLEIVPQAGDDRVDGSTLGAELRLKVEPGPDDDTVLAGAADDLITGALGMDHVDGGPGADLIRVGPGIDVADGGPGHDRLVGGDGADQLAGSDGDDTLEGGDGNDTLLGGPGEDILLCGNGFDTTDDDGDLDTVRHCEQHTP
jgi:hypothetical protein